MNNRKILVVATTDNMIWQFLIPHIKHMQSLGNTVECACNKSGFWFDELKDKYGFVMHEITSARNPLHPKNIKGYKQLKKLVMDEKFDLIYCQQPVGGLLGRLVGSKCKIPVIYTAHGFHFFKGAPLKNNLIFKPVEKWLAKKTDVLITINDEDYQNALKMKAKKVYKINGIGFDNNKYKTKTENRDDFRKELGISDEFVILTVAEFIKRKNYNTMLKTIAQLKNENIKFLICGTGRDKKEIESLIEKLQIQDKVQLLGYRKDINSIMNASDIFFLPSHQEGLTLSIIEALNFGLPVVTSDVRGNRDLIDNGVNGFVCNANDYLALADCIKKLMRDPELMKTISNNNLIKAKNYDIEMVKQELEKIYEVI